MLACLVPAIVNTAACHNRDIAVLANVKIIVHQLFESCLGHEYGDMHALLFGAGLDKNVDSRFILLGDDLDVFCGLSSCRFAVCADVVGACGHFMQSRHLHQQCFLNLIHVYTLLHYVCTQDCRLTVLAESPILPRCPVSRRLLSLRFCPRCRECAPDAR